MREVTDMQLARASSDILTEQEIEALLNIFKDEPAEKTECKKLDFLETVKKQFEYILHLACLDKINIRYENYSGVYAGIMYETRIGKLLFSPELVTWIAGCLDDKEGVIRKVARDEDIRQFDAVIEEFLIELFHALGIEKPSSGEYCGSLKMIDKCDGCIRGYLNDNKKLDFVWQLNSAHSNLEDAIEMLERVAGYQSDTVRDELKKIIKQLKGIKNEI